MGWLQWGIPLIAFVVWLISNMVKTQEEQRRPPVRTRPTREEGAEDSPQPKRTPAEIDKFLEEVRRRKQAKEQGRAVPPPLPPVVVQESPKPVSRQPSPRSSRPAPVRPERVETARPDRVEPVRAPRPEMVRPDRGLVPMVTAAVVEAVPVAEPVSEMQGIKTLMLFPHDTTGKRPDSNASKALHMLMKNRASLSAGFLLMEVLNKPVSKRRGGPFAS